MNSSHRNDWHCATVRLANLHERVTAEGSPEPLAVRHAVEAALEAVKCNRRLDKRPLEKVLKECGRRTVGKIIEDAAIENAESAIWDADPEQKHRAMNLIRKALGSADSCSQEGHNESETLVV